MKVLFLTLLYLILSFNISANESAARQSYLNKNYDQAKISYFNLSQQSPNNFSYQYNLAASYFRLDEIILAKVHFLKALKLSPGDKDTKFNIKLINKKLIDQQFIFDNHWISLFQFNIQTLLVIMLLITVVAWLFYLKFKDHKSLIKLKRPSLLLLFIWTSLIILVISIHVNASDYGIVIAKKAKVFSGPSITQKSLFFAHEGAEYKILKSTKIWTKVQFPNGLKGWIKGDQVVNL